MFEYFQGKTVLITGASGFIGSHLVKKMLSYGAQVIGVDNFITGRPENLQELLSENLTSTVDQFTFIKADVTTPVHTYLTGGQKVDLVLHFASPASPPRYQQYPVETYLVNSIGTHYLLDYIKSSNPEACFVFAGTSEAYGDPQVHPQPETYWGNVNPNGKRSCYDESKRLGETICGVFFRDFSIDARIVRIFNTYGPQMDPADGRIIPNFVMQALKKEPLTIYGDGSYTRSYCFVDDLVEYILRMASFDGLAGETINIGNPTEYTILQTAQMVQEVVNPGIELQIDSKPLPSDDPSRRKPDITKAIQLLQYQPRIEFAEGLKQTVEFFKKLV